MNRSRLALVTIAFALLGAACNRDVSEGATKGAPAASPASAAATPDQFAAARETYAKRCAVCHGEKGEGATAEVEGKKIKGPSFRTGHALKHTNDDFLKQIVKGGEGMPAYGDKLSAKEIDDLINFIRHEYQAGNNPQPVSMK